MLGAADIRISFITADRPVLDRRRAGRRSTLGAARSCGVAAGSADHVGPHRSPATAATATGSPPCRPGDGAGPGARAVAGARRTRPWPGSAVVMPIFGAARRASSPALAGWAVARNGLRPVRRLTADVERDRPHRGPRPRSPVEGDDEIARLATAFNQMLTALAASRDRQRQLVADAGHELRTPLTSLRTNLDLLTQADQHRRPAAAAAQAELLDDVRAQIEELTTLIGDLVELARDEPMTLVVEAVELPRSWSGRSPGYAAARPACTFDVDARAVVGRAATPPAWSARSPTCSTTPPSGARRAARSRVTPRRRRADRRRPGPGHRRRRTCRTSSSGSTAPRSPARCPAPGSGCRSCAQVVERHAGHGHRGAARPRGGARLTMTLPGRRRAAGTAAGPRRRLPIEHAQQPIGLPSRLGVLLVALERTVIPPPVPSRQRPSPAVVRLRITTPRSARPSAAIQPNAPA